MNTKEQHIELVKELTLWKYKQNQQSSSQINQKKERADG